MPNIKVPSIDQVDAKAQGIFNNLKSALGIVPNIYATIGYSSNTLEAYLQYDKALEKGSFSKKETEAINLIVSQVNGCEYCLAAHTAIAQMNGYSKEDTIAIRTANLEDQKIQTIIKTAQAIAIQKGNINDDIKTAFFNLGYGPKEFVELIAIVNAISFTNFIHNATKVPVDFPTAPLIETIEI